MTLRIPHGPDGWQMAMAAYALCNSASILGTPNIAIQPAYTELRDLIVPFVWWGYILLAYAIASTTCLFVGTPQKRVTLGLAGIPLWMFLGTEMLIGSYRAGAFWSPAGAFEIMCGIGCAFCVIQWGTRG